MKYNKQVFLNDGTECLLRNASASDAKTVYDLFNLTHAQTENLLSYPDENSYDVEQESRFLEEKENSENAVEICAFVNGKLTGTAGIEPVGSKDKVKHRAEFGITVERSYWRKGIGRALTMACIECAALAGYTQLELKAVSTNTGGLALYKSAGFVEYGRNPKGFRTRGGLWQELVLMYLKLDGDAPAAKAPQNVDDAICLRGINAKNLWQIVKLSVSDAQKDFVATNTESILEAYVTAAAGNVELPFAIYAGETPVGFVMLGYSTIGGEDEPDIASGNYSIWRFMIDEQYQGKGYGRAALAAALEYIRTMPCGRAEYCRLSYEPENSAAKALYASAGFLENGETDGDEIVAILKL